MKKPLTFVLALAVAALFSSLWAGPMAYRLQLTILTDKGEEYVYFAEIDERQFTKIENAPSIEIRPFIDQARRECAEKIGYRKEIYGPDNYKMVQVIRSSLVIRELGSDRIVFKR